MRLLLFSLMMLNALIVISQPAGKETKKLFDSLLKTDLSKTLYDQIEKLENENKRLKRINRSLDIRYNDMEEFSARQDVYRNLLDKLEAGVTLNNDSLSGYYSLAFGPLFEIADSVAGFPVKIYYATTVKTADSGRTPGVFPFNDIGQRLFTRDTLLMKHYPKVYNMIANGKIYFAGTELGYPTYLNSEVPKWYFPALYAKDNTLAAKKALAADLLDYISTAAYNFIQVYKKRGNNLNGDLIPEYLKFEQEKYSKATIDEKITIRRKFIEYLKMLYKKHE